MGLSGSLTSAALCVTLFFQSRLPIQRHLERDVVAIADDRVDQEFLTVRRDLHIVGLIAHEALRVDREEFLRSARHERAVALGHRHGHQTVRTFVIQFPPIVALHGADASPDRNLDAFAGPVEGLREDLIPCVRYQRIRSRRPRSKRRY